MRNSSKSFESVDHLRERGDAGFKIWVSWRRPGSRCRFTSVAPMRRRSAVIAGAGMIAGLLPVGISQLYFGWGHKPVEKLLRLHGKSLEAVIAELNKPDRQLDYARQTAPAMSSGSSCSIHIRPPTQRLPRPASRNSSGAGRNITSRCSGTRSTASGSCWILAGGTRALSSKNRGTRRPLDPQTRAVQGI